MLRQVFQDGAGHRNRVRVLAQSGDGPRPPCRSLHDRGVQFHVAKQVRVAADPDRMVIRVEFHNLRPGLHSIQGRAARPKRGYCRFHADAAVRACKDNHFASLSLQEQCIESRRNKS